MLANQLSQKVQEQINQKLSVSDEELKQIIFGSILQLEGIGNLNLAERVQLGNELFNSMRKYDLLQELLDDEEITEIMVVGAHKVFVEKKGKIERTSLAFIDVKKLEDIIQRMVGSVNRLVNEGTPIVDARLSDGSRINIVLPPVALDGPILTIRKFSKKKLTMEDLVAFQSLTHEAAAFLEEMVIAKYNLFICGGTGSGKTTFLNVLSNSIPNRERIVTIEDSAELKLEALDHVVRLETRNQNTEGVGAIPMKDLIKSALRMRPDRIVVGEVRGEEAFDMLQAMNTGHEGSMSTGHSNTCMDMLSRLENMILMGKNIPLEAIRNQIGAAIEIIIFVERNSEGQRKVTEIVELIGYVGGSYESNKLFERVKNNKGELELIRTQNQLVQYRKRERFVEEL